MPELTTLEKNILKAKGLTEEQLVAMEQAGVSSRADLAIVGDPETLCQLMPGLDAAVAVQVINWAIGRSAASSTAATNVPITPMVVDSADVVYCIHCKAKQPKDYKSGDLCIDCGKQAEPIRTCFWCAAPSPGKFCRQCGAEMVAAAELDLAVMLRQEGLPKDDVPKRLKTMTADEKDVLWGRVRKLRQ